MSQSRSAYEAVLFDLDGTLVDTAGDFIPAVQRLRLEAGASPMAPERITRSVSNGSRALVTLALGLGEGDADFEMQRQRLLEFYSEVLGQYAEPYPGIRKLLTRLEQDNLAWGIVTNKPRTYAKPLLETLNLQPQSLVCPDDVRRSKPDPESLFLACKELNCDPDKTIYIGDHLRDIEAGQAANMYTVAAAYGYIEEGDDAVLWGADLIAESSEQLASLILNITTSA
ncbi:MAG: HAD-IA family hydrolase [Pseudomonadota bacterium]